MRAFDFRGLKNSLGNGEGVLDRLTRTKSTHKVTLNWLKRKRAPMKPLQKVHKELVICIGIGAFGFLWKLRECIALPAHLPVPAGAT